MKFDYDVIVIGAGHAGCEAAAAAARLGVSVLLITGDLNRVAQMSCNPAVGGIAKGQIVREIDALGGEMGRIADATAIQFRMLNRSKGPAVWSPRVQSDRTRYIDEWRRTLDSIPGLDLLQDIVVQFLLDPEQTKVTGVLTKLGISFKAKTVILTAGTFLNGKMHFGESQIDGGRISEESSYFLTEQLRGLGFDSARMKTGTPMRIDGRSIDYSLVEVQGGDDTPDKRDFHRFSFLPDSRRTLKARDCYIVHTNPATHEIIRKNLDRSPLYNGSIKSIGPRYCPSIETKIVTFAEKESHQLFLEPEGETTQEFYVNGFSSSLPWDVQFDAIRTIPALKNVHILRPGYAIEYDFFDPRQLRHSLSTKRLPNLFFAGQINGTTGYEEAAGQGLVAGINAARMVKDEPAFVLRRDQAYLGVLIDDLVTKGVDEPYRMFTSRAEYRILLRQDDADMRLTPLGYELGLVDEHRMEITRRKRLLRDSLLEWMETHKLKLSDENNDALVAAGTSPMTASTKYSDLIKRPQLNFPILEKISSVVAERVAQIPDDLRDDILEVVEIRLKYAGYIERERLLAEKTMRLEYVKLPMDMDYDSMKALSTEARQKLSSLRPETIGQASRIPGVSPADVSVLLLMTGR